MHTLRRRFLNSHDFLPTEINALLQESLMNHKINSTFQTKRFVNEYLCSLKGHYRRWI